jgi:hypothetical protein
LSKAKKVSGTIGHSPKEAHLGKETGSHLLLLFAFAFAFCSTPFFEWLKAANLEEN